MFSPVTETRRKQLQSKLPAAVYYCDYCDMELVFKHVDNAGDAVARHLSNACHGCPKEGGNLPRLVKSREDLEINSEILRLVVFARMNLMVWIYLLWRCTMRIDTKLRLCD